MELQILIQPHVHRPTEDIRNKVSKTRSDPQKEESEMCSLLQAEGGLEPFLDAIASGRPRQDAWKALQAKKGHRQRKAVWSNPCLSSAWTTP